MKIRITAAATIGLLTLAMTAVAQDAFLIRADPREALAAAQDGNPELAALTLQRENARVAFDRASASIGCAARSDGRPACSGSARNSPSVRARPANCWRSRRGT